MRFVWSASFDQLLLMNAIFQLFQNSKTKRVCEKIINLNEIFVVNKNY